MNIGNIFNKIGSYIDTKKEENRIYNELVNNSLVFTNFSNYTKNNNICNEGRCEEYMLLCPNLNKEYAMILDSIVPIYETALFILYTTQKKDNKNYVLVFTNYRIFVIDKTTYTILNYQDIKLFDIISKSLMTQIINFNNIILGVDTNKDNIENVERFFKDSTNRYELINNKTKYLCGIVPVYQRLNKINSGISIDNNRYVVFHDRKEKNYKVLYDDILNYELMEDGIVVLKKKTMDASHSMKSVKQSCSTITLRVTLKNNEMFVITLLESSAFASTYNHTDQTYINNFNFSKEIIDKLDSLAPKLY